jgi:O-antigen/teichoic acid export membrane protein
LGIVGYGAFSYAMAWVGLLSVPSLFGLKNLLVRNIAIYQAESAWDLMGGLLRWANRIVLVISLTIAVLGMAVIWTFGKHFELQMLSALPIALLILPLIALIGLRQATLQGLHYVVAGRFPEMIIRPIIFIFLIGGAYFFSGKKLTVSWAVGLNMMAMGVTFAVGTKILYKTIPAAASRVRPMYQRGIWIRSALPMMFISGMHVINGQTDTLILGAIKGSEAVAIYNVADRGAQLVTFALAAVNATLSPLIASLHARGDLQRLQRVITDSTRMVSLISGCVVVIVIALGDRFLALFGPDFTRGYLALSILNVGQLINVAMGPVALLLIMARHEHDAAVGIGVSAVLNILLNTILIPEWGVEGAATATTISIVTWNLWLGIRVYKRLGIHPTLLGKVRLRRGYEES